MTKSAGILSFFFVFLFCFFTSVYFSYIRQIRFFFLYCLFFIWYLQRVKFWLYSMASTTTLSQLHYHNCKRVKPLSVMVSKFSTLLLNFYICFFFYIFLFFLLILTNFLRVIREKGRRKIVFRQSSKWRGLFFILFDLTMFIFFSILSFSLI